MHLPDWLSGVRLRYQRLAIGWCLGVPLMLRLGSGLSCIVESFAMNMADDWVVPLVPLRLSVIIRNKAVLQAWMVTLGGRNRYYSLCEWYSYSMVVTLPDQHLTRPHLAESVLDIALGVGGQWS